MVLTALVAAAALALAAAAFGALTPSAYRAQANAACAKAGKQRKALGQLENATNPEIVKWVAAGLVISRQQYATLHALQPPASLAAAHQRALGFEAQELAIVEGELKQMNAGADPVKVMNKVGFTGLRLYGRELSAWAAAGVRVCSSGGFEVSTG